MVKLWFEQAGGAGKLGYVEKWQRQRTNISQWLWQHGGKTQVDVRSGAKLIETFSFFLRRIFPKNVGQEDPTVWIGYIFMIAISLFHSRISIYCFLCRMTFCREFLWENFFGQNFLLQSIFWQMTQSVIWVVNGTQIKALVTFAYDLLMLTENFWQKKW